MILYCIKLHIFSSHSTLKHFSPKHLNICMAGILEFEIPEIGRYPLMGEASHTVYNIVPLWM